LTSQFMLSELLKVYGTCDTAGTGEEGVEAVSLSLEKKQLYQLICLDIQLPGINGQEVLKKIRFLENEHRISGGAGSKVLMVSAHSDQSNVMNAFRSSCDGFLVKPFSKDRLQKHLKDLNLINNS
ncbi:MAG: response regulator, partial [Planctomycetes bacterium]|nr:response regulator [Planctomycetota bacterium]